MYTERSDRNRLFTAGAATLAAVLYAARSVQALVAGELDHMAHTVSSGQPLVTAAAAVMAFALLRLRVSGLPGFEGRPATALLIAAIGLLWVGTARLIELLGVPGPWGFYSGPGLVAYVGGLAVAGFMVSREAGERHRASRPGHFIVVIALLRASAGLVSMTLFNVLGRDVGANVMATRAGHALRLLEALCWLALAVLVARPRVLRSA